MENIVNFLVENYLWIMAVLIIGIITAIGFLADVRNKNKKTKKQKTEVAQNQVPVNPVAPTSVEGVAPMTQQVSEVEPLKVNLSNSQVTMGTPNVNTNVNQVGQTLNFANQNIPVQPVQSVVPQAEPAMINPTPMSTFDNMATNVAPRPVQPVSIEPTPVAPIQPVTPTIGVQPQPSYTVPNQQPMQPQFTSQPVNVQSAQVPNMYQSQPNANIGNSQVAPQNVNPQPQNNPTTNENQFWKL